MFKEVDIEKISTTVPYTDDQIDIELHGKNLILTGSNGSGKTSLVDSIYKKLIDIVRSKKLDELKGWEKQKLHWIGQRYNRSGRFF